MSLVAFMLPAACARMRVLHLTYAFVRAQDNEDLASDIIGILGAALAQLGRLSHSVEILQVHSSRLPCTDVAHITWE